MNPPTINAHVSEPNGAYFEVKLHFLPAIGDLIKLRSLKDAEEKLPPVHYYEVVKIGHVIHDITDKRPSGEHFPIIFVKKSDYQQFEES